MLNIEITTEGGSKITVTDAQRYITKAIIKVEVSESDTSLYGGLPLKAEEVTELIQALRIV